MKQLHIMRGKKRMRNGLRDLIQLLPDNCIMAEVGSYAGESAQIFMDSGKVKHLSCVDTWCDRYGSPSEKPFDERMSRYPGNVRKLKMTSEQGAKQIPDGSLDFVYIDADHSYEAVRTDIKAWLPKVRKGGFIGGHDYNHERFPGVIKAVHERFIGPDFVFQDCSWIVLDTARS